MGELWANFGCSYFMNHGKCVLVDEVNQLNHLKVTVKDGNEQRNVSVEITYLCIRIQVRLVSKLRNVAVEIDK